MSKSRRPRRSNAPPGVSFTPTPPPPVAKVREESPPAPAMREEATPSPPSPREDREIEAAAPETPSLPEARESAPRHVYEFPAEDREPKPSETEARETEAPVSDVTATPLPEPRQHRSFLGIGIAVAVIAVISGAFAYVRSRTESKLPPPVPEPVESVASAAPDEPRLPRLPEVEPSAEPEVTDDAGYATDVTGAKREALAALDAWRLTDAIGAGERAVGFDPHDGEAWLILGAAYQVSGRADQARRCYQTCVQQGRQDPGGECGAMLRGGNLAAPPPLSALPRLSPPASVSSRPKGAPLQAAPAPAAPSSAAPPSAAPPSSATSPAPSASAAPAHSVPNPLRTW